MILYYTYPFINEEAENKILYSEQGPTINYLSSCFPVLYFLSMPLVVTMHIEDISHD